MIQSITTSLTSNMEKIMSNGKETKLKKLERELKECKAQAAHMYHFASAELHRADQDHLTASAAIVEITALGGRVIVAPIAIRGGLSRETLESLRKDMVRSYEEAIEFKPRAELGKGK